MAEERQRPRASEVWTRVIHLAGALASLALVIALVVWGYRLAMRDVHGVPVIRALSGPMRVAPENPGGEVAAHQGLAVNGVAAEGVAARPPEQLVLAPRPVELTDEDQSAEAVSGTAPAAQPLAPVVAPAVAPAVVAPTPGADPDAVAKALAEALATDADLAPVEEEGAVPDALGADGQAADVALAGDETAPAPEGATGPRPKPRPPGLTAAASPAATDAGGADAADAAGAAAAVTEVSPDAIAVGTRLVQLGAFDSADQARAEWTRLSGLFGPLFDGKALVVQSAQSGGRTFYRLRAHGFADEAEARAFCLKLLEKNASCIPVEQR